MENERNTHVTLVGIGMGTLETLTFEAARAIREADVLIGAKRMLEPFLEEAAESNQEIFTSYRPEEICAYIGALPAGTRAAVLLSGDAGFYSGARKLLERLPEDTEVLCGISSMLYFCSRLKTDWEDVLPVSLHGRGCNLIGLLRENRRVFALTGSGTAAAELCKKLVYYGMGDTWVSIGERLSYPDEKITAAAARDLTGRETDILSVMLFERKKPKPAGSIPDADFVRGNVPMTKEEIRCISVSKLRLKRDSVVYDIGAGTGSVSVEAAVRAVNGRVYAFERKEEALRLLELNRQRFAADNLVIVPGSAPESLGETEAPDAAFIGGSGGNMKEILACLFAKNPSVRVVINVISLETLSGVLKAIGELVPEEPEILSVSIAKARKAGTHHMMMGQNPVYIISFGGEQKTEEEDGL